MSYSVPVNFVVVLSFIIFVFYLLGVQNILTNVEENGCEMTYMFEFPQFVEISLPASIQEKSPRYALFGYAEGGQTERLRQMKFTGIPVLFIPGSSGSFKQGRSLASVSLRKALNSRTPFHFDYFMVDFNEDQSAVYGGTLEDHTIFVRHCIKKILSFYQKEQKNTQTSVILIGHSLGGVIAKAVFIDPDFKKESVQLIIGLAAPLKGPVLQPDPYITHFYKQVEACWTKDCVTNHTTLVSVGGGHRDLLVRSDLTYDSTGHINVLSSAVPGVWCSTDHLSIVWCKQLVLTLVRALFDCIDVQTKQLIPSHDTRLSVMKYHLVKRSAGKRFATNQHVRFVSFDREGNWYENMLKQFSVVDQKVTKGNTYIMIRLYNDPNHELAFIETFNLNIRDWIYTCSADTISKSVRICENGENLSNFTEIAPISPSKRLKRKFAYLNLLELKSRDFTHVVIRVPKMDSFFQVNVDIHEGNSRIINQTVPGMYTLSTKTIIEQTKDNSIYYKINLIGFESVWQAFSLGLEAVSCKTAKNNAVVSFMTPWASQHYHFYMNDEKSIYSKLKLMTAGQGISTGGEPPFVRLNLDPTCTYKVTIKPSLIASASQIVLYFSGVLPAFVVTILLLTVRQQSIHLEAGECVFFHSALCSAVRRYYRILETTFLGSKILGLSFFTRLLPQPDLSSENMDSFLISIVMYGVAIIVAYSSGIACYVAVVVSGKAAHKMALKFIAKTITGFVNWSEWVVSILQQVPILVSAMLVSLALSTSGALSLILGTIFYFLKISSMYEEYLEDILHYSLKFIARKVRGMTKPKRESHGDEATTSDAIENKSDDGEKEENSQEACEEDTEASSSVETETNERDTSDQSIQLIEDETKEVGLLSSIHFHVSMFLLWSMLALLHTPSLLVWARNYHYSVFLERDPALVPSLILNVCGAVLWQSGVPYSCKKLSRIISASLFVLAAASIIYASVSLYRLGYVISAAVAVVTVNQLVAKFAS